MHKTTLLSLGSACGLLLLLSGLLLAPAHAAENVLTRLNDFLKTRTFQATFEQKVFDEKKTLIVHSKGTLAIQKPGKFRWEYLSPSRQVLISDGKNFLNYDPELNQAAVHPLMMTMAYAPMMILLGESISYKIFKIDIAERKQGLDWLNLTPKVEDTEFVLIEIGMNKDSIVQLILHDQFGQQTFISFINGSFGQAISNEEFRFHLPEKTDIIGNYSLPTEILDLPTKPAAKK